MSGSPEIARIGAQYGNQLIGWFTSQVWTVDTAAQLAVLGVALFAGLTVRRILDPRLAEAIGKTRLNFRAQRILHNLRRLVLPAAVLAVTLAGMLVIGPDLLGFDPRLCRAAAKLLTAWIVIKMALQFVDNAFARNLFALTIWVIAALSILGLLDRATEMLDAVGMDFGQVRLSALTMIKGLMALFVLLYGALFLSGFLERRVAAIDGLTASSRVLLSKAIRIALVTFALLIGVTAAGIDLSLLAVFSGAVGLGLGFGLQKVVSNLFSGMLLLLDKSIKPGDIIELDNDVFGWVEYMGARYTEIVTRDNKSFLIPNEDFITQRVVNWSHGDTLIRLEVKFGVHYESDPHLVRKIAADAAVKVPRVVADPAPVCHLTEFGESALNFKLRFWIRDAEEGITNVRGLVMLALWDAFRENGIKIPYPHREVYMHMAAE